MLAYSSQLSVSKFDNSYYIYGTNPELFYAGVLKRKVWKKRMVKPVINMFTNRNSTYTTLSLLFLLFDAII